MKFTVKRFPAVAALSAVAVFVVAEYYTTSRIAYAQAHYTPYTVRMENRVFANEHGNVSGELLDVVTSARRSDGAFVKISPIFGRVGFRAGDQARLVTLPTGERFNVYDHLRLKTSWASEERRNDAKHTAVLKQVRGCITKNEQSTREPDHYGTRDCRCYLAPAWKSKGYRVASVEPRL